MSYVVEQDWTTKAGLRAACLLVHDGSHRRGYVGVPKEHPLYGKDYSEMFDLDVHGGLTFSGNAERDCLAGTDLWWFGFDCAHLGDGTSSESYYPQRSKCFVEHNCENLAEQLAEGHTK